MEAANKGAAEVSKPLLDIQARVHIPIPWPRPTPLPNNK